MNRLLEITDPFATAGDGRYHRHTELLRQLADVDGDSVAPGFVHEVQAHDDPVGDLQYLEDEVEVTLQARRIDHHHRYVRLPEQQEVAGHLLIGARRLEGVRSRKVHHLDPLARVRVQPLGPGDRLSGPVSGVLAQAGELVEHGALARVRIAGQRDEQIVPLRAQAEPDQTLVPVGGAPLTRRRGRRSHLSSPPSGRTRTGGAWPASGRCRYA